MTLLAPLWKVLHVEQGGVHVGHLSSVTVRQVCTETTAAALLTCGHVSKACEAVCTISLALFWVQQVPTFLHYELDYGNVNIQASLTYMGQFFFSHHQKAQNINIQVPFTSFTCCCLSAGCSIKTLKTSIWYMLYRGTELGMICEKPSNRSK